MKALTYKETAFLMNISDDAAIYIFIRYLRNDKVIEMHSVDSLYRPKERKEIVKDLRESLKGERIDIEVLSKHFNLNVHLLIDSINDRFFKSKECLDYLEAYFKKKWVPNAKTGHYPVTMTAPPECVAFMDEDNKQRLKEWFSGRYKSGKAKIECILKMK